MQQNRTVTPVAAMHKYTARTTVQWVAGPVDGPCDGLDQVVQLALGVGAGADGETDQVHRGRGLGAVGA